MRNGRLAGWHFGACALLAIGLSGCAFIPTPVRLVNKPHVTDKQAHPQAPRLALIIRDERPEAICKCNMCGVMRNGYMIPTSFAFLAHREHLDQIVAYHLKANFEHLGYEVVAVHPQPPTELSAEKVKASELDRDTRRAAWSKDRKGQDDRAAKKKGLAGGVETLDEQRVSAWGADVDLANADAVIELKVRKYWSDCNYLGVFAWMSANLAVCDAQDTERRVVFGKKVRGFGYGTGFTPIEAYNIPLNGAYWFVLHEIEKTAASDEFQRALTELRAARASR